VSDERGSGGEQGRNGAAQRPRITALYTSKVGESRTAPIQIMQREELFGGGSRKMRRKRIQRARGENLRDHLHALKKRASLSIESDDSKIQPGTLFRGEIKESTRRQVEKIHRGMARCQHQALGRGKLFASNSVTRHGTENDDYTGTAMTRGGGKM